MSSSQVPCLECCASIAPRRLPLANDKDCVVERERADLPKDGPEKQATLRKTRKRKKDTAACHPRCLARPPLGKKLRGVNVKARHPPPGSKGMRNTSAKLCEEDEENVSRAPIVQSEDGLPFLVAAPPHASPALQGPPGPCQACKPRAASRVGALIATVPPGSPSDNHLNRLTMSIPACPTPFFGGGLGRRPPVRPSNLAI